MIPELFAKSIELHEKSSRHAFEMFSKVPIIIRIRSTLAHANPCEHELTLTATAYKIEARTRIIIWSNYVIGDTYGCLLKASYVSDV